LLSESLLFLVPVISFGTYNNESLCYRYRPENIITGFGKELSVRGPELVERVRQEFGRNSMFIANGVAHAISWQFSKDEVPDWVADAVFHPEGAASRLL